MILRNAITSINLPSDRPEKTGLQRRDARDDLVVILDRDITGINNRKYEERQLARAKKSSLYPIVNNTTMVANNATVKIKLSPDDRFIGHDVIKQSQSDDVKVIVDK